MTFSLFLKKRCKLDVPFFIKVDQMKFFLPGNFLGGNIFLGVARKIFLCSP